MNKTVISEVIQQLENLPVSIQRQVLDFIKKLTIFNQHGVPGKSLLKFAGAIPPEDLALMSQAIEEDCEQVDMNEW